LTESTRADEFRAGLLYAIAAFGFWGLVPIYFKAVGHVGPLDILAHRVVWSLPLTALLITAFRGWDAVRRSAASGRVWVALSLSAALVAVNWLTFIYGVTTDRILQTSLGYYINPLVNVVLGVVFLGERLSRPQAVAVVLAGAGTLNLAVTGGEIPWIALVLAFSFGFYGLIRKLTGVASMVGLLMETTILFPVALLFLGSLAVAGGGAFGRVGASTDMLLIAAGPVTALPLIWFAGAARRLPYTVVGLCQYLAPSLTFLLAVLVYGEPFTVAHAMTFGCIWGALALFSADLLRRRRASSAPTSGA
jgi:chloramphenicol-sensitive protein RarD